MNRFEEPVLCFECDAQVEDVREKPDEGLFPEAPGTRILRYWCPQCRAHRWHAVLPAAPEGVA